MVEVIELLYRHPGWTTLWLLLIVMCIAAIAERQR